LLQVPGATPVQSKLIVQLREDKDPRVIDTGRGLTIEFPPPTTQFAKKASPVSATGDTTSYTDTRGLTEGEGYTGRSIRRLEIKNSDIQDVLRLIAQYSGYNIVVGDDVVGKVGTLSLENIPWDQAFALILQSKKLGYVKEGNVLRVGTLQSLKSEKEEELATEQAKIKVEPLRTLLIPISYAKATELAPQAKSFLSDRGTVGIDSRTNTIIVKDVDKVVNRVQKLFAALDTQPPRVSISANRW
jgi:type II secretory pathway component HofQ